MSAWTLLFDIDGTLMTSQGAGMQAMVRTLDELYGITAVPDVSVHGRTDQAILRELFAAIKIEHNGCFEQFNECYVSHLPATLDSGEGRLLPGVENLLQKLEKLEHVELGLLTGNLQRAAEVKLKHIGVDVLFSFGGYGDLHADRNDVAQAAIDDASQNLKHRFDPDRVWVIGDTPNDIRCARHIGAKVVAVETGGGSASALTAASPDLQFVDLTKVDTWINSLTV